jgi:hypothetical protein
MRPLSCAVRISHGKALAPMFYLLQASSKADNSRTIWDFFLLVAAAGALGGVGNALMSNNGFILPRNAKTSDGASILQPGVLGNVILGVIAALVFWLLNTDFDRVESLVSNVTMRAIGAALLAGAAGARVITGEIDKRLLRAAAVDATKAQPDTKRANEIAAEIKDASPAKALEIAMKSGYRCGTSSQKVEVLDVDGTCKMTRYWKGVKVVGGLRLPDLHSEVQVTTPGSSIRSLPRLVEEIVFPRRTDFTVMSSDQQPSACRMRLEVEGGLTEGDPELNYGYEYVVSRAFLMTREEVEEAYKHDSDVIKGEAMLIGDGEDADAFEVELTFPTGFVTEPEWGVMHRKFGVQHDAEYQRIRGNKKKLPWGYRFWVESPLSSCEYYIHWWPPGESATERPKPAVDVKPGYLR